MAWSKSIAAASTLLVMVVLATGIARGTDFLEPGFGNRGVAEPALPAGASSAAAGIVDLVNTSDGGYLGALGGLARYGYFGIVRLTSTGALASSFGTDGFTDALPAPWTEGASTAEAQAEALALQGDGKIVVAGYVQAGVRHPNISGTLLARYDADGSLDPGFGTAGVVAPPPNRSYGNPLLHGVAIAGDGRIFAVGGRSERFRAPETAAGLIFAYRPDGSRDPSFGKGGRVVFGQRHRDGGYTSLWAVRPLASGKILVAGYRDGRLFVARLLRDGSPDPGFGGGDGVATVGVEHAPCCRPAALALQSDGKIVLAANGGEARRSRVFLVRLRPNGSLDRGFGHRGVSDRYSPWRLNEVTDLAIQADGGILTAGRGARTKAEPRGFAYAVFRNRADGSVDRAFGREGLKVIHRGRESLAGAALSTADGGVLTGGSFAAYPPPSDHIATTMLLARFDGARR